MVTVEELQKAIRECETEPNPTYSTCMKLASYYVILDHMELADRNHEIPSYSNYSGNSEFIQLVNRISGPVVMSILDDAMDTISVIHPKLYNGIIRKLKEGAIIAPP